MLPLGPIVRAFRRAGYDGDYDVELLGEEFDVAEYPALLEHARTAFQELMGGPQH